jgi:hypothetical protein
MTTNKEHDNKGENNKNEETPEMSFTTVEGKC